MTKMEAGSLAELTRMVSEIDRTTDS